MPKSVESIVEPTLLIWARTSAGLEIDQAARKAGVSSEQVLAWENGGGRPTIVQLRSLAKAYSRPLAVFYLPNPPKDFQALRDFRRLPGQIAGTMSPELRYEIRRAQDRREIALELYQELGQDPPSFALTISISDDPEKIASRIRKELGISYEEQVEWSKASEYDALKYWRTAIELNGVLVFLASGVDTSEMRGFSISQRQLPIVVANVKDSPRARIFSLLHELSHVMLKEGGLCDLYEESYRPPEEQRIEVFCNRIAGAILIPKEDLLAEEEVSHHRVSNIWTDEEIKALARKYGSSREAMLRRLLICGQTTEEFYQMKRKQFLEEYRSLAARQRGGPVPQHKKVVSRAGRTFIELVLNNYYMDHITASDVADYLEVRLKHLGKIENEIFRSRSRIGVAL